MVQNGNLWTGNITGKNQFCTLRFLNTLMQMRTGNQFTQSAVSQPLPTPCSSSSAPQTFALLNMNIFIKNALKWGGGVFCLLSCANLHTNHVSVYAKPSFIPLFFASSKQRRKRFRGAEELLQFSSNNVCIFLSFVHICLFT